jgi:hypothetical protein
VKVNCSVVPRNDIGFDVYGHLESAQGGVTIQGQIVEGQQSHVFGAVGTTSDTNGWWLDTDCKFATTDKVTPSIAPGRLWGTLTCSHAKAEKTTGHVCLAVAEVRLENCEY